MSNTKTLNELDPNKQAKQLEKEVKNSKFISITKKFPVLCNKKVIAVYSKIGPFVLPKLGEGRKNFKTSKISLDNCVYIGEVSKNLERDGFGCLVKQDGSVYEGYFSVGNFEGKGRLINLEGNIYEGNWQEGLLQGEGKVIVQNPYSLFVGVLEDGMPNGEGRLETHDGSIYKGEFLAGKKHGQGKCYLPDGSRYEGEFCRDKQYGHGTFYFTDGSYLEASWDRGKVVEEGKRFWPNGRKYTGQFNNTICEGKGTMEWPDGRKFEGFWLDDRPHGIGTETKISGNKIEGNWRAGKLVKITNEHEAPQNHKLKSGISETVRDIEDKVQEKRKKLNKEFNEKEYLKTVKNYHSNVQIKDEQNKQEMIKRYNDKMEGKILSAAKTWAKGRKIERNVDFMKDCAKIAKVLNEFNDEIWVKFKKILKLRMDLVDFDYCELDLKVTEGVKFVNEWIEFQEGCFYRGEMLNHIPEGRGACLTKLELYEGYFNKGKKQGLGRLLTKSRVYTGYWQQDEKFGFGILKKKSTVYSGEFEFDKESGFGVLKKEDARYEGQWKLGKQHGKGILKYKDGIIYQGDFFEGIIKGFGSIIWPSGKSIIGYWDDGEIVGESQKVYLPADQIPKIPDEEENIENSEQSWQGVKEPLVNDENEEVID